MAGFQDRQQIPRRGHTLDPCKMASKKTKLSDGPARFSDVRAVAPRVSLILMAVTPGVSRVIGYWHFVNDRYIHGKSNFAFYVEQPQAFAQFIGVESAKATPVKNIRSTGLFHI